MFDKWSIIWELMRGQRLRYGGALLAMCCGIGLSYLIPWICQVMLDGIIAGKTIEAPAAFLALIQCFGGESVLSQNLWIGGLAIVIVTACSGMFGYLRGRWSSVAAENIALSTRNRLYDQLQHLPCTFFAKRETGDLVQRCTSDLGTVQNFLSGQVLEIGRAVVMLIIVIPIMLHLDWRMALLSLGVVPPIVLFSVIFFLKVKSAFKASDEAEGKLTAQLQENLTGIRVVRAFARQEFECSKFAEKNADYRNKDFRLVVLLAWYWSLSDVLCIAQNGIVLLFGAWWLMQGDLTAGTLFLFILYVNMFLWPVRQMGRILTDLGKTQVSLGRIDEILQAEREDVRTPEQQPLGLVRGEVAFENVSFAYPRLNKQAEQSESQAQPLAAKEPAVLETVPVIHDISVSVPAGQMLAILGPSGAGKSTLMHLLLRLNDPSSGRILLDGRDIAVLNRRDVRSVVSVVMQEPFLFSKSLRDNIKLGRPTASDEEMIAAAQAAAIHDSIAGFEKGYDTVVGERGVTLSGGQRQRVALARALLKNSPILILDDALSAVDTETEAQILDALRREKRQRTILIIAHRLSTLMQADRIIVLDKGRIVQRGTHQSLVQAEGIYRRLWNIQSALEDDLRQELETAPARTPQPVAGG